MKKYWHKSCSKNVSYKNMCCLFHGSGFLHGHVSYLSDDCQACLLLLTVDRDVFFTLSEAKQKIVEVRINFFQSLMR